MKITGVAISCVFISACDRNFDDPVGDSSSYNNGTADFTKFVSIGDSLTAGFADGALYLTGQQNSYPAILAQQFSQVGGGEFTQPLVSDNFGGVIIDGGAADLSNRLVLNTEPKNPPSDLDPKGPEPIAGTYTTSIMDGLTGSFNNMGVPGAKSFHLGLPAYGDPAGLGAGTANPFFVRFASSTTTTVITDAAAQQASFFVMWIGNNDVLSYATSGGTGTNQTGNADPTTYGSDDITDPGYFAGVYSNLVTAITTANADAKGVLVNIPDVSTIPYFTTVPYNAVPLDQVTVDLLTTSYEPYNTGLALALTGGAIDQAEHDKRKITFQVGQNAVVIADEDLTDLTGSGLPSMRQATANDLLVLTTKSKIGTLADANDPNSVWGVGVPLVDADVLIPSEISEINTARLAFNTSIEAIATADPNLLFYDVAATVNELSTTGINYGTGGISSTYATGGAFSLDGIHPTAQGYAVISNRILDVINSGFNANIPPVDPGTYTTIFIK